MSLGEAKPTATTDRSRGGVESWLQRRWYGGVAPGLGLHILAWLYGWALRLRGWLYRRGLYRTHRLRVPVIVVGNRVAGGTGKTPLTIALAQQLAARGWRPGIVSRGYGRESRLPVRIRPGMSPALCGDEPLLIARRTGLPVAVDSRSARPEPMKPLTKPPIKPTTNSSAIASGSRTMNPLIPSMALSLRPEAENLPEAAGEGALDRGGLALVGQDPQTRRARAREPWPL